MRYFLFIKAIAVLQNTNLFNMENHVIAFSTDYNNLQFSLWWSEKAANFLLNGCRVNITYIKKNGEVIPVRGKVGDNILYLAHRYDIEMEGEIHVCHFQALTAAADQQLGQQKE